MPRLSIGDAEIFYESHGDGPPLLLVPGLGGMGAFWANQVAALKSDLRVIVHDHRGTGQSTRSRIAYSVDQMADDVLRLMDGLKIDAAHLVGHSTGGAIGQTIAQDRPERIKRLVLSATWAGADGFFRRSFETRKELLRTSGAGSYWRASALMLRPPRWISENEAALLEEEKKTLADPPDPEILTSRIDAIIRFDRRAGLGRITAPTLVICAQDDMVTPLYMSQELALKIAGATLAVLTYGGHFAPLVMPTAYNKAVGEFLRG